MRAKLASLVRAALRLPPFALALLVAASVAALAWCFLLGGAGTPLSYAAYALSAYALTAVSVAFVPCVRRVWNRLLRNERVARLVGDEGLRATLAGGWSAVYDLAYVAFALAAGLYYDSSWAVAVSLYHVAVAAVGFSVAWQLHKIAKHSGDGRELREAETLRNCGAVLLVLALALAGVIAQMVFQRQAWVYHQIVVIGLAAFAFTGFSVSLSGLIRIRRASSPALMASRAIGFSKALVQVFFLETTMIAVFGGGEAFRFAIEAATGSVVLAAVAGIAVKLVVSGSKRRAALGGGGD